MEMTNNEKRLSEYFEELVPVSGKADTVAGELVRAICRIGYRWWNDGDMIGVGYGKETVNAPARYIMAKAWMLSRKTLVGEVGGHTARVVEEMCGTMIYDPVKTEGEYDVELGRLEGEVLNLLTLFPELFTTPNNDDMWDYKDIEEDVDDSDWGYDDEDGWR